MEPNNIDADYKAIVLTLPEVVTSETIPKLWAEVEKIAKEVEGAHRIVNAEHARKVDSSGLAVLIELLSEATNGGAEFAILNPGENIRALLDIYHVNGLLDGRVLDADHDGDDFKQGMSKIPNVIGCPAGEIRLYANGKMETFTPGEEGYVRADRKTRVGLTPQEFQRRSETAKISKSI